MLVFFLPVSLSLPLPLFVFLLLCECLLQCLMRGWWVVRATTEQPAPQMREGHLDNEQKRDSPATTTTGTHTAQLRMRRECSAWVSSACVRASEGPLSAAACWSYVQRSSRVTLRV